MAEINEKLTALLPEATKKVVTVNGLEDHVKITRGVFQLGIEVDFKKLTPGIAKRIARKLEKANVADPFLVLIKE